MNDKFDELTKGMAQSVTRRAALKRFGIGLAGMALTCLGLGEKADAATANQCLGKGALCGYGLRPTNCTTNCCSHTAHHNLGSLVWYCN
jgi:hypothetical protein